MTDSDLDVQSIGDSRLDLKEARRNLSQRLAVPALAFSADGHGFTFQAPIAAALPTGSYVRMSTPAGVTYLGQITAREQTEFEGPQLNLSGDAGLDLGPSGVSVTGTSFRIRLRRVDGQGLLLGRMTDGGLISTTPADLYEDADIEPASDDDVEAYLRTQSANRAILDVGTIRAGSGAVRAGLHANGFDRHTFLCGQSGSGKTYSLGVVLERLLLDTDLRIVIIDPNSDFVHLNEPRPFAEATRGFGPTVTEGEYAALSDRYRASTSRLHVLRPAPRGHEVENPLRIRFSDLAPLVQALVLQIDPLQDREEYNALLSTIQRMDMEKYSLADLRAAAAADLSHDSRGLALRISNLGVDDWDIWAERNQLSLADPESVLRDWRALVLDVGGFSRPEEKSLVATAVFGLFWHLRESRQPVLIVVDEAHNVCPQSPTDRLQAEATERAIRIAGEGRKFGLYLLVSTQRPQKLHANVVSQCDNLILMRMNSASDIARIAEDFSFVPRSFLDAASSFRQGESLLAGKLVPSPMFARFGGRVSREGGSDVPTAWASPR